MKKLLLGLTLFATTFAFGQSNKTGTIQVGFGLGGTLGFTSMELSSTNPQDKPELGNGGGGGFNFGLRAQFGIIEMISAGFYVRRESGAYIAEFSQPQVDETYTITASGFGFGFEPKFYLVNKDKFNLNFAPSIGYSTANTKFSDDGVNDQIPGSASGLSYGVAMGTNFYFGDKLGMSIDLGYASTTLSGDLNNIFLKDFRYEVKNRGLYLGLGFIAKF